MNKYLWLVILVFTGMACNQKKDVLYHSDVFSVYPDKVVQGDYEAHVVSQHKIISNYRSTASEHFSRLITFKFSINEKDNENQPGADHWLIIGEDEHESPVIKFGEGVPPNPGGPGTYLPVNYKFTIRVDMSPVLNQFKEKGYYETFDGGRIAKADFKAVYVAGGAEPLTWDFSNLEENDLELKDPDGDGIFELKVILNPFDPKQNKTREWTLTTDLSEKPAYHSNQPIVDALFNLSMEEAIMNIEPDSTLRTGTKWGGVWTRDISYSIFLAFAYHEPEIAKISLMKKVKRGRIIQDTGSGGAWPVSSDRTTWVLAAWELYKVTGNKEWLEMAYHIIKNTLDDDLKTLPSPKTGMNRGESSFLDWREQTYPKWMSNMDIYVSENLSTNVVHFRANIILAEMAKILDEPYEPYLSRGQEIKEGINEYLWMPDKGYYGQYLYGRGHMNLSPKFEALGEALAILFDVANVEQANSIIAQSPVTAFGTTCVYPQIPGIPPYHNNGIWPFVQSYWNLAAAKAGNEKALNHGLAAIYRAGALFLTNYENFVAETGDYIGTEINSDRMLWSMAGNLAMVHRVFMGISFEPEGIRFNPVIPKAYSGTKTLSNFKYRNTVLDIKVVGFGNRISSFRLDGQMLESAFLPDSITGRHSVLIRMADKDFGKGKINLVRNKFTLPNPQTELSGSQIIWNEIPVAASYTIYKNGKLFNNISENHFDVDINKIAEYKVTAVDNDDEESFTSEPIFICPESEITILEAEGYSKKATLPYTNYSGDGFVEISRGKNREIEIEMVVDRAGTYLLDCRYANGTGPWNTDNNCAIRSLYVNQCYEGVLVFPQRGTDEWSDWGFSNAVEIQLNKGKNDLKIIFEDWNENMDVEINEALLDYFRLIRID